MANTTTQSSNYAHKLTFALVKTLKISQSQLLPPWEATPNTHNDKFLQSNVLGGAYF